MPPKISNLGPYYASSVGKLGTYTVILLWSTARSLVFATDFGRIYAKIGRKFSKLAEFRKNKRTKNKP
jgi:hypothetical protein